MMSESLNKLSSLDGRTEVYCTHEYTLANLAFATAADPCNEKLLARLTVEQKKRELGRPTLPSTIQLERETNPSYAAKMLRLSKYYGSDQQRLSKHRPEYLVHSAAGKTISDIRLASDS